MTREELLTLCRRARDVGSVKHEDFIDYIVVLTARRRIGDGWQEIEQPYMCVAGRLAMANEDARHEVV